MATTSSDDGHHLQRPTAVTSLRVLATPKRLGDFAEHVNQLYN